MLEPHSTKHRSAARDAGDEPAVSAAGEQAAQYRLVPSLRLRTKRMVVDAVGEYWTARHDASKPMRMSIGISSFRGSSSIHDPLVADLWKS